MDESDSVPDVASSKPPEEAELDPAKLSFDEESFFAFLVLICVLAGVVINVVCLVTLRRHRSVFHKFMKMLAVFDIFVVFFCAWLYSMPVISEYFKSVWFLPIYNLLLFCPRLL